MTKRAQRIISLLLCALLLAGSFLRAPLPAKADEVSLTGLNLIAYNVIKEEVLKIASGERTDTKITVTREQLGIAGEYHPSFFGLTEFSLVADENGVNHFSQEVLDAVQRKFPFDPELVMYALFRNLSYAFYWSLGQAYYTLPTRHFTASIYSIDKEASTLYFLSDFEMNYPVAKDFCNNFSTDPYCFNVDKGQDAGIYGIAKARSIVAAAAGLSDYDKLLFYAKKVSELTSYNHDAIKSSWDRTIKSPWNPMWVFDDDSSTNVVCQGYAKAFQYLCDLTTFNSPKVKCRCASGNFLAPGTNGGHMWNVVTMDDGKNYLVDVTSFDSDDGKYCDGMFLAVPTRGTVNDTYTVVLSYGRGTEDYNYTYDDVTRRLFSTEKLTLSTTPYAGKAATSTPTPEPTATNTPTPEPSATNTPTPKPTATNTPTPAPTATNTPTPKPTATNTPTPEPTATNTPTPEPTVTNAPTEEPRATNAPTPTLESGVTGNPTEEPGTTGTPTGEPGATNTPTQGLTGENQPTQAQTATNAPLQDPSAQGSPTPGPSVTDSPVQTLASRIIKGVLIAAGICGGLIVLIVITTIIICKKKK